MSDEERPRVEEEFERIKEELENYVRDAIEKSEERRRRLGSRQMIHWLANLLI